VGEAIAERIHEAVVIVSRSPWNQRCLFDAATGLPVWGDDYYSNMAVWALPMALSGVGIEEFCAEGQLVSQMLAAAPAGAKVAV
jgi:hypothetical protein